MGDKVSVVTSYPTLSSLGMKVPRTYTALTRRMETIFPNTDMYILNERCQCVIILPYMKSTGGKFNDPGLIKVSAWRDYYSFIRSATEKDWNELIRVIRR